MSKLFESLKYLTVLFQLESNHLEYIKSTLAYRIRRKIKFPRVLVRLKGSVFETRKNSLDIAHISNLYEKETTKFLLKLKPKKFVDVGTHIGRFSILMGANGSEVISIEPSKRNFNQLNKNVKLNNLQGKITPLNFGCSNEEEISTLYFNVSNEGATSLKKSQKSIPETIILRKLDAILKEENFRLNDKCVIKIDVEGSEFEVLKGATKILKENSPLLIVELLNESQEFQVSNFLSKFGFVNNKRLDSRNFVFVKK